MRNNSAKETFEARLEKAKADGVAGRKELLDRLSRMPMDKVIGLPASSLAILGPSGLAKLAAVREDLAGTGRKIDQAVPPDRPSQTTKAVPHPIRSIAVAVASILVAGVGFDLMRPILMPWMFDPGMRSRQTSIWPSCPRLDRHVDGCVYTVGGERLSLGRVAAFTDNPVDRLLAANRHLPEPADVALPRGSRVVIWRGMLQLEGASL